MLRTTPTRCLAVLAALALLLGWLAPSPASAHAGPGDHPVSASPATGLHDGDVVDVSGGPGSFPAGTSLFIAQCSVDPGIVGDADGSKSCRLDGPSFGFYPATAAADGSFGPVSVPVHTGQLGTDPLSVCPPSDPSVPPCVVLVSNIDSSHLGWADLAFASAPAITVDPDHARRGDSVSVSGSAFDAGMTTVDFDVAICDSSGASCDSAEVSSFALSTDGGGVLSGSVTLDAAATTGERRVQVTQTNGAHPGSASADLHVLGDRGIVLSPSTGGIGTPVAIAGTDFDPAAMVSVVGLDSTGTVVTSDVGSATVDSHGGVTGAITILDPATAFVLVAEDDDPSNDYAVAGFTLGANSCTGSGCTIDQTVVQSVTGATLSQSQAAAVIDMTPITLDGTTQTSQGDLNAVTVIDARGSLEGWSVTATLSDLTDGSGLANHSIPATNMVWTPECGPEDGNSGEVIAGSPASLHNTTGAALCTAAAGGGGGTFVAGAALSLEVPAGVAAATYAGTLTVLLV